MNNRISNKISYLLSCCNQARVLLDEHHGAGNWTWKTMLALLLEQGVMKEDCKIIQHAITICKICKDDEIEKALKTAVEDYFEVETTITDKPSIQLYLALKNKNISEVVEFLKNRRRISSTEADLLNDFKASFDLSDAKNRELIGAMLTNLLDESPKPSRMPKANSRIYHPAGSYKGKRERQLLRHVATQCYFAFEQFLKKDKSVDKLVEVQIMHLEFAGRHHLFVAMNLPYITHRLQNFFSTDLMQNNLKKMLTTTYSVEDKEGNKRSQRFARKLLKRIFSGEINLPISETNEDLAAAKAVGKILANREKPRILRVSVNDKNEFTDDTHGLLKQLLLKNKEDRIHFLMVERAPFKSMHAEEFLVLIAKYAKQLAIKENTSVYTCVAGKKRPCMGCCGKMKDVVDQHGQYPGIFWMSTLSHADPVAALAIIETLLQKSPTITVDQDGVSAPGYDSGSDSEEEAALPSFRSRHPKTTDTTTSKANPLLSHNIFDEISTHDDSESKENDTNQADILPDQGNKASNQPPDNSKLISALRRHSLIKQADGVTVDVNAITDKRTPPTARKGGCSLM